MIALRLLGLFALVAVNGFFAAVEFSLVAVRLSRVRQLVSEGRGRAKIVLELTSKLDRVVSGVQVGITLASLGLGALGESTLAAVLSPVVANIPLRHTAMLVHAVSLAVAFLLLTILHVVLGELVPKGLSLQRAERVALLVAPPFQWYLGVFSPAISLLDGVSRWILRGLGLSGRQSHTLVHSAEELQIQIQEARERGLIGPEEEKVIVGAIELDQVKARELMVPMPDVHSVMADTTLDDVMRVFVTTQRSRLPVFEGKSDHVLGYIHIKDVVWVLLDRERRSEDGWSAPEFNVRRMLHEIVIVPESKSANEMIVELRARHGWMAMVVDEFGTILGLVTLEDILEQLVGEIHDEYDVIEKPLVVGHGAERAMIFDASLSLHELESLYNISLPEDPAYATAGGFVLAQLGFIPRGGESFEFGGYRFTVVEMDRRRVARVKIQRSKQTLESPVSAAVASPDCRGEFCHRECAETAMIRHIGLRLLYTLPALWLILTMVFLLIHIVPGDPVLQMLGQDARVDDIAQLRHSLGLDQPLAVQYAKYLEGLTRGDWGRSMRYSGPVRSIVLERFPATLELSLAALLVCIAIAIPAGIFSARRRGSRADRATSFFTLLGLSVPNFALGPVLILIFSIEIGWLPVSGRGTWSQLILPAVTLGAALAAILTRMVRGSMIEELSSDYVRTARAKGITETAVLFRHAFPNALIPVITIVGLQFGSLLAGTIVTESIFSWPGIGRLAVQAISARDYPLLQGCILVIAVSYVAVNLLTDLVYAVVDPRVRLQ